MQLTEEHKTKIKKQALEESPKECCGILLKNGDLHACINASGFPQETFAINFADLKNVDVDDIAAFYHSHPQGTEPSITDKYYAHKRNLESFIYAIKEDEFTKYKPDQFFELPLIGRDFITNEVDCITLVRDYYKRNLNINIEDINHQIREIEPGEWKDHPEFWKYNRRNNEELIDLFKKRGFILIDEKENIKEHDLILSDNGLVRAYSHCAVYIGGNSVMHHPYPTKSTKETMSFFKGRGMVVRMRHKNMM